jgi:hypothetical protein
MSTLTPTPEPALSADMTVTKVPREFRDDFDSRVRDQADVATPLPEISEAFIARLPSGDVAGVAYVHVRHLVNPYVLTEDMPTETLSRLTDAVSAYLIEQVGGTLAPHGYDGDKPAERVMAYDIYVLDGDQEPEGFERLPVSVWRRRVLWHGIDG